MTGEVESISGGSLVAVGVGLVLKGVDLVSTDLVTGVITIAVGAGLVGVGFYAVSVGMTKRFLSVFKKENK